MVEAHEVKDRPWVAAMFFVGFLLLIAIEEAANIQENAGVLEVATIVAFDDDQGLLTEAAAAAVIREGTSSTAVSGR